MPRRPSTGCGSCSSMEELDPLWFKMLWSTRSRANDVPPKTCEEVEVEVSSLAHIRLYRLYPSGKFMKRISFRLESLRGAGHGSRSQDVNSCRRFCRLSRLIPDYA
jgi:hypothetical protein